MDQPIDRVADRLPDGHGFKFIDGQRAMARCPAHNDRNPSLAMTVCDDSRLLLHCYAGCSTSDVLAALGLQMSDLFPAETRSTAVPLREFTYCTPSGDPLFKVERFLNPSGTTRWRRSHPGDLGWVSCKRCNHPTVLYRLPALLQKPDQPVWFTEGERDADSARQLGVVATTVPSGAIGQADLTPLKGRHIVLVADFDAAGWKRANAAKTALQEVGAVVDRVLRPIDAYSDLSDHISEGRPLNDLVEFDPANDLAPPDVPDSPPAPRITRKRDGTAFYVAAPFLLMLDLIASGRLTELDVIVYMALEERAGRTGRAHLSAAKITRLLQRKDSRPVIASLRRLEAEDFIEQIQKGRNPKWLVWNPSWPDRMGPLSVADRTGTSIGTSPSSSSTSPTTSPVAPR